MPIHRYRMAALLAVLLLLLAATSAAAAQSQPTLVASTPAASTPQVLDGAVKAFAQAGGEMVAGGSFRQVREPAGPTLARGGLMAFDAESGEIDDGFQPQLDGEVRALAVSADGLSVFVGGTFTAVDGAQQGLLAKLDLATGALDPSFRPRLEGTEVDDLLLSGSRLYVAGAFGKVDGVGRSRLAALDPDTGALDPGVKVAFSDPRAGLLKVTRLALSPDGTHMVVLGTFLEVDGQPRPQIAMLDVSSSGVSVSSWATQGFSPACGPLYDTDMRDVDFSPDGSYFVVVTTGGYSGGPSQGVLCDAASRWETGASGPGQQPTWVDYTGGDSLTAVAATGSAVYVGGHQRWLNRPSAATLAGPGAIARAGIAALDPQNGLPLTWNPGKTRGKGVFALLATDQGLWVGSDTDGFKGLYRPRLAMAPLKGGRAVPPALPGTLPGQLYRIGLLGRVSRHSFDGTQFGSGGSVSVPGAPARGWKHVRGAFMLSGRLYVGTDSGRIYYASFDGRTLGRVQRLSLHGLDARRFPIAHLTGMAYADGRLYYTLLGSPRLFWRAFEPQSNVLGAQTFVAAGAGSGVDWRQVRGMTIAGGELYYATSRGGFVRVGWSNGRPVRGTSSVLVPASQGAAMASLGMFVLAP